MSTPIKKTLVSVHLTDLFPDGTGKCATYYNHAFGGCWGEKLTFKTIEAFDELKNLLDDNKNHFSDEFLKGILNEKTNSSVVLSDAELERRRSNLSMAG